MAGFPTLEGSWPWPVSGQTAYCRASLIDLYLHAKFHWNRRNFCGRTDGHLRPAVLGRLCQKVELKWHKKTSGTYVESFMSVRLTDMWSMIAGTPSAVFAVSSLSTILKLLLTVSWPRSTTRTCRDIELRGTKMTGALRRISSDTRNALVDSCWAAATAPLATAALASRSFVLAASNRFTKLYKYNFN